MKGRCPIFAPHQDAAAPARRPAEAVGLWLAVAGLWHTAAPAHGSGWLLLAAVALAAAALPGAGHRLLTLAAVWTVLASAVAWQPGLGLGALGWSVLVALTVRLIAWSARRQPGPGGRPADDAAPPGGAPPGAIGGGRAAAVALLAGALLFMLSAPGVSWGIFLASFAVGGVFRQLRRGRAGPAATALAALAGGWLLHLAADVLIADELWQGVLLGVRPGLAWTALAGGMARSSLLLGVLAALPQAGLDWPLRRPPAVAPASPAAGGPAPAPAPAPAPSPAGPPRLHLATLAWAVGLALVALLAPEAGATWLRVADGGVWAATLAWWGLGAMPAADAGSLAGWFRRHQGGAS